MLIYEYRCEECGKVSEFLLIKSGESCKSKKMSRVLSKVRVIRSEESRMESLADPSKWGGLDNQDPKAVARWMKRMGKEMGEEMDQDMDQMVDEAMEEEANANPMEESKDG